LVDLRTTLAPDRHSVAGVTPRSSENERDQLLAQAVGYLKSYRAMLLESRGGAASGKEQYALALSRLIERLDAALARPHG
jgi:hypothetical protein